MDSGNNAKTVLAFPGRQPPIKGCHNCAHVRFGLYPDQPPRWGCGYSGGWCRYESAAGGSCGPSKVNWAPRPPGLGTIIKRAVKRALRNWLGDE